MTARSQVYPAMNFPTGMLANCIPRLFSSFPAYHQCLTLLFLSNLHHFTVQAPTTNQHQTGRDTITDNQLTYRSVSYCLKKMTHFREASAHSSHTERQQGENHFWPEASTLFCIW